MERDTLCLHADENTDAYGAIATPIYQSATFVHDGDGVSEYSYSRLANPTRAHLERVVAALENGAYAVAFSTGMAAISCVFQLLPPTAHIIATEDLYGGSLRLFRQVCARGGMQFDFVDTANLALVESLIRENTAAIYVETPSNPLMQVSDLSALAALAKKHGLLLIADNTFLTPYLQNPLDLGADIVVHSGTKYLCGHNDTLAGFAVTATRETGENLRYFANTLGAPLSPFDCFLLDRGIKTLALRMERINENAGKIAEYLSACPKIKKVYYAGSKNNAGYSIGKKQARGFGGMISIELESEQLAKHILGSVKVFQYAESLGGVDSLITYPIRQTHADVPKEERDRRGINEKFLRLSVGIENANDLIADLKQAIEG